MSQRVRGLLDRLLARRRALAGDGVSDAELLRRYAHDRDEAAFELLVWRYGAMVLGLCRRAILDEQLAEDAFQAVFLVLARKAAGVRENLGGWLFKVARRVAHRAAARQLPTQPVTEVVGEPRPDPVEQRELAEALDAEIARLPAKLRQPVVLCYLSGIRTEDVARELGCPRGTVLSRLATARTRLADRLTRRGITLPAALALGGGALTPHTVSAALSHARQFMLGAIPLAPPALLAHGVIHAMNRTPLFATVGGALIAVVLASGVSLVVAQNGPPAVVPDGEMPVATAAPTATAPPAQKSDPDAAQRETNEKLKKLEKFTEALRQEIEEIEKVAGLTGENSETALSFLHKRLAEAEQELARTQRELDRFEIEVQILQKQLDEKPEHVPLDPTLLEQVVAQDPAVVQAKTQLAKSQALLASEQSKVANPNHPHIKELETTVAALAQRLAAMETKARAGAESVVRTQHRARLQKRVAELQTVIAIKQAECEKLRKERDALQKLIAASAPGARTEELKRTLEPRRQVLAQAERQKLLLRAQREGVTLPDARPEPDAKLDAILKELAALRKEVQELKQRK